jgi:hypothetical protein
VSLHRATSTGACSRSLSLALSVSLCLSQAHIHNLARNLSLSLTLVSAAARARAKAATDDIKDKNRKALQELRKNRSTRLPEGWKMVEHGACVGPALGCLD